MASTTTSITQAFVLRPETVRHIAALLAAKIGPASISALCADDVEREFADVDALIAYDNVRTRELRQVEMSATSGSWQKRATVSFSSRHDVSIDFSISAEDDQLVVSLRRDILAFVGESRPWYGRLATLDFWHAGFAVFLMGFTVFLIALALGRIPLQKSTNSEPDSRVIAGTYLTILGCVIVIGLLSKSRTVLFPAAVFAIGEGEHRFQTAEKFRWGVVVAFVISVAASLLAAFVHH